jgi:hypothetical protein
LVPPDSSKNGQVDVDHVGTGGQLADVLTKALERVRFIELHERIGIINVR